MLDKFYAPQKYDNLHVFPPFFFTRVLHANGRIMLKVSFTRRDPIFMPRMLLMNSKTTSHRDRGHERQTPEEYQQYRPVSNILPMIFQILMTSMSLPILTPYLLP